jgi:hypothetical protein
MMDEVEKLLKVVYTKVSLRSLEIEYVHATDSSTQLSSLTNLTSLKLHSLGLNSTILESIFLLTQLRHLKLEDVYLKDAALVAFVRGVAGSLLHLTTLQLGAELMSIEQQQLLPLTSLRGLKDLRLSYLGVEAEGVAVLKQLPITSAEVNINAGEVGEVCSWLQGGGSKINALELLGDSHEQLSLPEVELLMSTLRTCAPQLQSLSLSHIHQLCHCTSQLASLTQLTRLTVLGCKFDDAALLSLSALTGLQELSIRFNKVTWAGGFECLASSLQQLTHFELQQSSTTHEAAERAFGSRVIEASRGCLTLKPGIPADEMKY